MFYCLYLFLSSGSCIFKDSQSRLLSCVLYSTAVQLYSTTAVYCRDWDNRTGQDKKWQEDSRLMERTKEERGAELTKKIYLE